MEVPIFYFDNNDLQANGNISETAVRRECKSFENITSKLLSELKYLDNVSGEPITISIGGKDLFKVSFVDHKTNIKSDT